MHWSFLKQCKKFISKIWERKIADVLAKKKVISISYIAPNENLAQKFRESFKFDRYYMEKKFHKEGPL